MTEVKLISSCLVAMSNTYGGSRMELSPWDLQFILRPPNQRGLLYKNPDDHETQEFNKTRFIDRLKTSLSRTLDDFPPLSGRIGTEKNKEDDTMICFFIDCNNAGAEFAHAMAHGVSVSDIVEPAAYVPEIVSSFFLLNEVFNCDTCKPLLGVQVTELVDGFFIGITANHAVVDGESFWHFVNSWSEISRGLDAISKPPVLQRWLPPNLSSKHRLIPIPATSVEEMNSFETTIDSPALLERIFHFSKESMAELKEKANTEAGTTRISTFQSLLAHLWRSVKRVRLKNAPENKEIPFVLIIGARSRIPLPQGYFGNAVYVAVTLLNVPEDLSDINGLGRAALKLYRLVCQQTSQVAVKFFENWVENPAVASRSAKIDFVVGSSPRFNVYGNDFGWGKPVAVRSGMANRYDGMMTIFQGAEPGSVDVEACLAPETMHSLEDDAEFMQAVTI
ncbi:uncharacterized acetyltransferase At3g50280-like [Henckelia pumila]|uniref:uncharacterized acetyltransferase At3g50280-like n=1 Tax=Henckelia pumila TaxID=405737 RepID=UPI003C6E9EE8